MPSTTLIQHIRQQEKKNLGPTGEFTSLMTELSIASKLISKEVNRAGIAKDILGLTGEINVQGEEVQKLDKYANETFIKIMSNSGTVCAIGSEENERFLIVPEETRGNYIFMMDPLDGSSNIDVNVSIGTIFSIYRKISSNSHVTERDLLQKADRQVAAGYIIYGPSTMFVYTTGRGVFGFTLDSEVGDFFLSHPEIKIPNQGSTYSINEGSTIKWDGKQKILIQYFKTEDKGSGRPYKQRYIGTLVADFHRTLLKGGIFMYPGDRQNPRGKLRFVFEAAPLAFVVSQAGGRATDGQTDILSQTPENLHQRTPLFIGSTFDLATVERHLK